MRLILLNKPFHVLPQFTSPDERRCLREFVPLRGFYPAGRLEYDSEGLMVLTDFGPWQARISQPGSPLAKTYLAQLEGEIRPGALDALRAGVTLSDGPTRPAQAEAVAEPDWLWPRHPPIRFRKAIPTAWLTLTLREGRNRRTSNADFIGVCFKLFMILVLSFRFCFWPFTFSGYCQPAASEVSISYGREKPLI